MEVDRGNSLRFGDRLKASTREVKRPQHGYRHLKKGQSYGKLECAEWIRQKLDIKSVKQTNFLHGKLYHLHNGEADAAILGSSNFTARGLGLQTSGSNIELNLVVDAAPQRDEIKAWFDKLWADPNLVADVKADRGTGR